MNRLFPILAPCALALLSLPALAAGPMTRFEFELETAHIASTFTHARAVCDALTSNTRDICVEEARAVQSIAHAELAFRRSGHLSDAAAIPVVRAEAGYAVARERCDEQTGADKARCLAAARSAQAGALAEAKAAAAAAGSVAQTPVDARREAEYQRAVAKCEAMASDTRSHCLTAARKKAGKT
ncbi:hypothetical protein NMQ14_00955 [Methyloversatilis sp. XJ19-13]|uniref:hypothetical protein n=1 Tax=Methyloversatilis sp. XJ19-13 TaxID=2963430 RepID=UPI00211C0841|nr:hypothetical protein [Methyloversatilis sp. XJ19-13]MCQ9372812.1 hypothetical protein [Methyloversatilis sp. XJ19-13]